MRLHHVRDFVAVVESGAIRAAARKLGVSQPAVTKSIRNLEAELHVQLLQRTPQGIVPTAPGRAFLARARVIQSEIRKAEEELAHVGREGEGEVALGVGPTAAFLIVPEAVVRFREQFPRARVRILEGFLRVTLPLVRDETLDLAVGPLPEGKLDPAIAFRPLVRHDYIVVGRKGHPLRNARSLAQLANADWVMVLPPAVPGGPLDRAFSMAGLPGPQPAIHCESYNIGVSLLAKTDMLGIWPRRILAESFARDSLRQIEIAEPMPSYTVGTFTRRHTPLTPLAQAMA